MASKTLSQILTEITDKILSGGRRTTAVNTRSVLTDLADSSLNKKDGGLVVEALTGYTTDLTPTDDKHFASKKYVDDNSGSVPDATETVKGKSELVSDAELDSATPSDNSGVTPSESAISVSLRQLYRLWQKIQSVFQKKPEFSLRNNPTSPLPVLTSDDDGKLFVWENTNPAGLTYVGATGVTINGLSTPITLGANSSVLLRDRHISPTSADYAIVGIMEAGNVVGPVSSTDNNVVVFDGTTGKIIKDSGVSLSSYWTLGGNTIASSSIVGATTGDFDITLQARNALLKLATNGATRVTIGTDGSVLFTSSPSSGGATGFTITSPIHTGTINTLSDVLINMARSLSVPNTVAYNGVDIQGPTLVGTGTLINTVSSLTLTPPTLSGIAINQEKRAVAMWAKGAVIIEGTIINSAIITYNTTFSIGASASVVIALSGVNVFTIGTAGSVLLNSQSVATSGAISDLSIGRTNGFLPASGTSTFSGINLTTALSPTNAAHTGEMRAINIANNIVNQGVGNIYLVNVNPTITQHGGILSAFRGNIASGTNRFNLHMTGTAVNLLQGNTGIGVTPTATSALTIVASTTTVSQMNTPAGVAPTAPVDGDMWSDSTRKALGVRVNGTTLWRNGVLYSNTAAVTITNTVSETSIFVAGTSALRTLGANFAATGKAIRVKCGGVYTTPLTASFVIKIKLGSTILAQITTTAINNNPNKLGFVAEATILFTAIGATGSVQADGHISYTTPANTRVFDDLNSPTGLVANAGDAVTVDTTVSQVFDVTATWDGASTSRSAKFTYATIEVLY
jgi:hypothetical protein